MNLAQSISTSDAISWSNNHHNLVHVGHNLTTSNISFEALLQSFVEDATESKAASRVIALSHVQYRSARDFAPEVNANQVRYRVARTPARTVHQV